MAKLVHLVKSIINKFVGLIFEKIYVRLNDNDYYILARLELHFYSMFK